MATPLPHRKPSVAALEFGNIFGSDSNASRVGTPAPVRQTRAEALSALDVVSPASQRARSRDHQTALRGSP